MPLTIAIHLSKNQRFAEAQRWFHYLFDPTDDSDGPTPERFWKVRPFQTTDVQKIEEILVNLVDRRRPDAARRDDPQHRGVEGRAVPAARHRPLPPAGLHVQDGDGLPGQPDRLGRLAVPAGHRRDHRRGDELYVLAANILGPRPQPVPKKGTVRPQTYANLRKDLDAVRQRDARRRGRRSRST